MASNSYETVKLWNVEDPKKEVVVLEGHSENVTSIAFAPDGKYLATGSADETLKLWSTETYKEVAEL